MARLSQKRLEELISKHHGNLTAVARELEVPRYKVERKILHSARLQRAIYEQRQIWADEIESVLRTVTTRSKKPDVQAGFRVLEALAPDRGWGKTLRIEGHLGMVNLEVRKETNLEVLKNAIAQLTDGSSSSNNNQST